MFRTNKVVTCFLESDSKILILKRSNRVGTYPGKWAGISGYIDPTSANATQQAYKEIYEETSLTKDDIKLAKKGTPLEIIDQNIKRKWIVHPYLFHIKNKEKISIDWEHIDMKWIYPEEISLYLTVPKLKEALEKVSNKIIP